MLKISAFADEISPDLDEQIRVCKANSVSQIELRGVAGKNVLDFDHALRNEIKTKVSAAGMGIIAIASPIGKVKINDSWQQHFERFKIAVELAEFFDAPFIRVFSYYPPEEGQPVQTYRDEVIKRFRAKVEYIERRKMAMVHENEKDIYGEKGVNCLDLLKTINSSKLRAAFDFGNFVAADEKPLDNWKLLKPYTAHIHIKDAVRGGGVKPAGEGDGQIEPILADAYKSGYRGSLSLEPHLKVAAHSHGETGPELFKVAADALKSVCRKAGVPLAV